MESNHAIDRVARPGRRSLIILGALLLSLWTTAIAVVAVPGEFCSHGQNTGFCEHGWPAVWLDRGLIAPRTTIPVGSPGWQKLASSSKIEFEENCDALPTFRFAETEANFSPQYFPPTANRFWSLPVGWPFGNTGNTLYRIRVWGLLFDLGVWFFGACAIIFCFRKLLRRGVLWYRFSMKTWLILFVVLSSVGASFAFYDQQRSQHQAAVEALEKNEIVVTFDFASAAPLWLDRVTDYRLRPLWLCNSFRRGVGKDDVQSFGVFDRVKAVRIRQWPHDNLTPLIQKPGPTAQALNQFKLEGIWISCSHDESVDHLLAQVNCGEVAFVSFSNEFRFDPGRTRITHFSNLESLYVESAAPVSKGFVASFSKLKSLTLKADSYDDEVIDEILALKQLEQLVMRSSAKGCLSPLQEKRLQDASHSFKFYLD